MIHWLGFISLAYTRRRLFQVAHDLGKPIRKVVLLTRILREIRHSVFPGSNAILIASSCLCGWRAKVSTLIRSSSCGKDWLAAKVGQIFCRQKDGRGCPRPGKRRAVGITSPVQRLVHDLGLKLGRPIEDGRYPYAAFMQRAFAASKIAVRGWGLGGKIQAAAFRTLLRRPRARCKQSARCAPIVAAEMMSVLSSSLLLQRVNNSPDLSVQLGDHGRIDVVPMLITGRIL